MHQLADQSRFYSRLIVASITLPDLQVANDLMPFPSKDAVAEALLARLTFVSVSHIGVSFRKGSARIAFF